MSTGASPRASRDAEHRFFVLTSWALLATVLTGFARSYFLRPWFPEHRLQTPPESYYYYVHGVVFAAWFLLAAAQPVLIATRKVALHRRLGWAGAALAAVVPPVGYYAVVLAVRRQGGFLALPAAGRQFQIVPLSDLVMFALFVALAVARRGDAPWHKRSMLAASVNLVPAAIARFPLALIERGGPFPVFAGADLFLVALLAWDVVALRRVHPATVVGLVATAGSQLLRLALSRTALWTAAGGWLLGG